MTSNGYSGTTVRGVAERVNERGIRINGDWLNVSKFKPLELPPEGSQVVAVVDAKGFLVSITLAEQAAPTSSTARDERITRLAVLKAAALFGASRDIKSGEVLLIANSWLAWVTDTPAEPEF